MSFPRTCPAADIGTGYPALRSGDWLDAKRGGLAQGAQLVKCGASARPDPDGGLAHAERTFGFQFAPDHRLMLSLADSPRLGGSRGSEPRSCVPSANAEFEGFRTGTRSGSI